MVVVPFSDDTLSLIEASRFPITAAMVILLRLTLGDPLALHKVQVGPRGVWIGFAFDLPASSATPRAEKWQAAGDAVRAILHPAPNSRVLFQQIIALRGLLSWV